MLTLGQVPHRHLEKIKALAVKRDPTMWGDPKMCSEVTLKRLRLNSLAEAAAQFDLDEEGNLIPAIPSPRVAPETNEQRNQKEAEERKRK